MDVLGEDLAADVQLCVGEIPDPAHAKRNELLGDLLRDVLGHGQYRNIGMARGEIVADLVERADKHVVDARANERGGESASLRATANLRVLYLDENAVPLLSERRSEVLIETDLPGSGQARVQDMYAGEIAASVGADGVELRFPVTFAVSVAETPRYPCLQSLEAEECGKKDENVPSLVLRAMKQGERLWDIAKLYRTTVEAILAANELKEESAAVIGKLLLIPRRR